MKKFLCFLSLFLILLLVLLVPVSASSNSIYTPSWDFPHLNQYPKFFGFSYIVYGGEDNDPSPSEFPLSFPTSALIPYEYTQSHQSRVCLFICLVDSDYFEVLPSSSFSATFYFYDDYPGEPDGESHTYSSSLIYLNTDYASSYLHCNVVLSGYSSARYCSLIPLSSSDRSNPSLFISSVQNTYAALSFYERGYQDGLFSNENSSYVQGFQDGLDQSYQIGYDDGSSEASQRGYEYGYSDGYAEGYQFGYNSGFSDTNQKLIRNTILYAVSSPFIAISNFLNFEVFGINFRLIFAFVFGCIILAFVIKHFVR